MYGERIFARKCRNAMKTERIKKKRRRKKKEELE